MSSLHRLEAPAASLLKALIQAAGLLIGFAAVLLILANQYPALVSLDPKYRITTSALGLICALATSIVSPRAGLIGVMFALPLQPKLAWQIQQYFGYGRILGIENAGLDLIAGFSVGTLINSVWRRRAWRDTIAMPWPVALSALLVTLSTALSIGRNLHQTSSLFHAQTLVYNVLHLRSLDWHDDFRPLFDWVVYGSAFLFISVLIPLFKTLKRREYYLFIPLMIALVMAALVGIRQSLYGIGYTPVQMLFRSESFGFMALGFQNDIHAFAGQLLIGAIGLWGLVYGAKSLPLRLVILLGVMPLAWIGLFLSKSKATFALALLAQVLIAIIWLCRRAKRFWPVVYALTIGAFAFLVYGLFFSEAWLNLIKQGLQLAGLRDLEAFNLALSYRPEVYAAGLHMFSLFPIFGMGQGEYYRQAANHDLTNSYFLSIQQNGENGHNYFLQTLVETGVVGGVVFGLLLLYPLLVSSNKRALLPAGVALSAIFIGNIFAHSLLVRETLFIAAGLLALLYVYTDTDMDSGFSISAKASATATMHWSIKGFFLLFTAAGLVASVGMTGVLSYRAQARFPFTVDTQCYKTRAVDADGWTSGLFEFRATPDTASITVNLKPNQLILDPRSLNIEVVVREGDSAPRSAQTIRLTPSGPRTFTINLDNETSLASTEKLVSFKLERCFIPRNLGINEDSRRLGLQIEDVSFNQRLR